MERVTCCKQFAFGALIAEITEPCKIPIRSHKRVYSRFDFIPLVGSYIYVRALYALYGFLLKIQQSMSLLSILFFLSSLNFIEEYVAMYIDSRQPIR